MAQSKLSLALLLAAAALCMTSGALARTHLRCEEIPQDDCAFSVSTSGARCVLEKYTNRDGASIYQCQTSGVMAETTGEWIESDECLSDCGLQRMSVGISTDGLSQREFLSKLCSPSCQNNCRNIVDLFTSLAEGEGVYLPRVCNHLSPSAHRVLEETVAFHKNTDFVIESLSTAAAAAAPQSSMADSLTASAPAPSPFD